MSSSPKPKSNSKWLKLAVNAFCGVAIALGIQLIVMNALPYIGFGNRLVSAIDWEFLSFLSGFPGMDAVGNILSQFGGALFGVLVFILIQIIETAPVLLICTRDNIKFAVKSVEEGDRYKLDINEEDTRHVKKLKESYNNYVARMLGIVDDVSLAVLGVDGWVLMTHYPPVDEFGFWSISGVLTNLLILVFIQVLVAALFWVNNFKTYFVQQSQAPN